MAAQVTGGVTEELYEGSSHLINAALPGKGNREAPSAGLWQHRITAQETTRQEKEDILGAHPAVPQCYVGARLAISTLSWVGLAAWAGYNAGRSAGGLWGPISSDQQPWHTKNNADHLHRGTGQGMLRDAKQVPNWVPWDPETIWAGTEMRGKAGEENSTL